MDKLNIHDCFPRGNQHSPDLEMHRIAELPVKDKLLLAGYALLSICGETVPSWTGIGGLTAEEKLKLAKKLIDLAAHQYP